MKSEELSLARMAYEAFCDHTGWRSADGDDLPRFHELPEVVQKGWVAASRAVAGAAVCGSEVVVERMVCGELFPPGACAAFFEKNALQTINSVVDALNAYYEGASTVAVAWLNVASLHLDGAKAQIQESQ